MQFLQPQAQAQAKTQAKESERMENTNPNPDHPPDLAPRRLKHSPDIPTAHRRLLRHGTLDQLSLAVGGDLARDPDLRGGADGLRVGPCCCKYQYMSVRGVEKGIRGGCREERGVGD